MDRLGLINHFHQENLFVKDVTQHVANTIW